MSLFPRTFYGADPSFTPLFRLLDDFDNYRSEVEGTPNANGRKGRGISARTFNPKFDVRETENTYELHGELPGIDRKNVNIEFTDSQTVVITGHVERSYQSCTPPAGYLEHGDAKSSGAITEGGEHHNKAHKVTVEDDTEEQTKEQAKEKGTVAKKDDQNTQQHQHQHQQPKEKFWVSERSIGEFSRTFSFPSRVDQDAVSASLNNGILNITVPKAKKHETRRIAVN